MATFPYRATVCDPDSFKISTYSGSMSERDARRKIKRLLDQMNFMISPEVVSAPKAGRYGDIPDRVPGKAIVQGVTYVIASNDDSDNNYRIEYGKPVCFDMVSGQAVTGINPAWGPDEYKVVGIALGDLSSGTGRIPVLLGVQPNESFAIVAKATPNEDEGHDWPSFLDWTGAETISDQQAVWDFELPLKVDFREEDQDGDGSWEGSGVFVRACNLTRQYVYKDGFVLLHSSGKPKLQFYCEFNMCQMIYGKLTEDLEGGGKGFAKITVNSEFAGGLEGTEAWVYDKMMDDKKKLKKDAYVYANLLRKAKSVEDGEFVWQFFVTQASQCPVSNTQGGD